jgi:hypothetical protein
MKGLQERRMGRTVVVIVVTVVIVVVVVVAAADPSYRYSSLFQAKAPGLS